MYWKIYDCRGKNKCLEINLNLTCINIFNDERKKRESNINFELSINKLSHSWLMRAIMKEKEKKIISHPLIKVRKLRSKID